MTPAMYSRAAGVVAEYAFLDDVARAHLHEAWPDLADAVKNLTEQWDKEASEVRKRLDSAKTAQQPRYNFTDMVDGLALEVEESRLRWERGTGQSTSPG